MEPAKQQWFSDVFEAGLAHRFYGPADVLAVASPQVLARHLPSDVLGKVLDVAMKAKLSPDQVVSITTPRVMASHIPDAVLWKCISGAAGKTGVSNGGAAQDRETHARGFLRAALESGLKHNVLKPEDVLRHLDARVLVDALPHELTAKLLATSLQTGTIDAKRVIDVIGVASIAQHAPTPLLWKCVEEIQTGAPPAGAAIPTRQQVRTKGAAGEPSDFHEAETDVRQAVPEKLDDLPIADVSDIEVIEEPLPPDPAALEEEDRKSGKLGALFGRRKR